MDYINRGLVRVISCEIVNDEEEHNEETRLFGTRDWIDDPDHDGEGEPRRVQVRIINEDMDDGTRCRLVLMDEYNTSICESTFAQLNVFGPLMRVMNPERSQFYIREIVASKNAILAEQLEREGMNPRDPLVGEDGRRIVPIVESIVGMATF